MARTLLIVDDDPRFRRLARRLLEGRFEIVGEASDSQAAREAVATLRPQAILLDVNLPDGDGFRLSAELSRLTPAPRTVLTSSDDPGVFDGLAAEAGALGFLPKASLSADALDELLG